MFMGSTIFIVPEQGLAWIKFARCPASCAPNLEKDLFFVRQACSDFGNLSWN
jgi:hypothetical protein